MMQCFRKFRVWGVSVTLFFFVTVFIPGQAKAFVPLALIPPALVGASLGAAAIGSYYATNPDAANAAASALGRIGRDMWLAQKIYSDALGDMFWGKPVAAALDLGSSALDWLGSIADQIPDLWNSLKDFITPSVPYDQPEIVGTTNEWAWSSGISSMPCGAAISPPAKRVILELVSKSVICASASNPPESIACLPAFVLSGTSYSYYTRGGSCAGDAIPLTRQIYVVAASSADTTQYPPVFDSAGYAASDPMSKPGVVDDVDKVIANPLAPPGMITPVEGNAASAAAGTAPPVVPLTQADLEKGLDAVRAAISADTAAQIADIAAANPDDLAAQIAALEAAKAAAQDALEAENEVPELPNVSATSEPAYTLPEVDFAARFQTFLTNIKSSSVFAVINNLNLPIDTGVSLISFDFGSWGGVQSLDFADYSDVWLILRGVFFAVFCFISTRIVILKR